MEKALHGGGVTLARLVGMIWQLECFIPQEGLGEEKLPLQ